MCHVRNPASFHDLSSLFNSYYDDDEEEKEEEDDDDDDDTQLHFSLLSLFYQIVHRTQKI